MPLRKEFILVKLLKDLLLTHFVIFVTFKAIKDLNHVTAVSELTLSGMWLNNAIPIFY